MGYVLFSLHRILFHRAYSNYLPGKLFGTVIEDIDDQGALLYGILVKGTGAIAPCIYKSVTAQVVIVVVIGKSGLVIHDQEHVHGQVSCGFILSVSPGLHFIGDAAEQQLLVILVDMEVNEGVRRKDKETLVLCKIDLLVIVLRHFQAAAGGQHKQEGREGYGKIFHDRDFGERLFKSKHKIR